MPTKSKNEKSQSWRVQFRLNPGVSQEDAILLEIMNKHQEKESTDRDICFPALWAYYVENENMPMDSDMRNLRDIRLQLSALRRDFNEQIGAAIQAIYSIPGIDLSSFRNADGQTLDDIVGEHIGHDVLDTILSGVEGQQFDIEDDE